VNISDFDFQIKQFILASEPSRALGLINDFRLEISNQNQKVVFNTLLKNYMKSSIMQNLSISFFPDSNNAKSDQPLQDDISYNFNTKPISNILFIIPF